jgi:sec-independent protein translocase protein TatC
MDYDESIKTSDYEQNIEKTFDSPRSEADNETGEESREKMMTLVGHLAELRTRIITAISFWALGSVAGWFLSIPAIGYFRNFEMLKDVQLILIRPAEAFMIRMKVAVVIGLLIVLPVILYQVLAFVLPALKKNEKSWVLKLIPGSVLLFYAGSAFALLVMLPIALEFFLVRMTEGLALPQISLEEYVNFLIMMVIMGGVIFQTPVLILFLTMIGVLSSEKLRKGRKYAIVIIFIVAALASPPDPFSQCVAAIPMLLLFELSIWMAKIAGK